MKTMSLYRTFLCQFIKNPIHFGAVTPSSQALAQRMVEWIDFEKAQTIVELGPGTGVFSREIISRISPDTTFFAIEFNKKMVECLRINSPDLTVYHDSALNVSCYLKRHGVTHADVIICGLPWVAFTNKLQNELLGEILKVLSHGGSFTTFMYLTGFFIPHGKKFVRKLSNNFTHLHYSPITWLNLPPAIVYRCNK